jgi:endonuclease/exonuclease/phosphatase family metal-dependent hydrolase
MFSEIKSVFSVGIRGLVIATGAVWLCGCVTSSRRADFPTFRVMTYNIHHGEGLDGKVDMTRIAALIKEERADIVALQEVDKGVARTARRDLPAELAALTGMTYVFSNNFHYQGGEYGNAVLTRFPVKSWNNCHYKMIRPNEQRGILQVVLDVRGRELVFMNTHIDSRPDDAERWLNVGEMEALEKQYHGRPMILCGDFNDVPTGRIYRRMSETFHDTWARVGQGHGFSFPANKPTKRIDYLWISKDEALMPLKTWIPESEASDHLPVVAEFELR